MDTADMARLKRSAHLASLPPEIWICIFYHATHVPGTLIPDIYAHASLIGTVYGRARNTALREALITKRALVCVCKQWWHLAIPYLYQSVYVGRARCISSLSATLAHYAAGKGTVVGTRPLGEYVQRLDAAIRDHAVNKDVETALFAAAITRMSHLTIISFATTSYTWAAFGHPILDALEHSAASLRIFDWSQVCSDRLPSRIVNFLAGCTQLRVLCCYQLFWSRELGHGTIPPTVTTLRAHTITSYPLLTGEPNTVCHPESNALRELILDLAFDVSLNRWEDFFCVHGSQLVSIQIHLPCYDQTDAEAHMELLTRTCPRLGRLTVTSKHFTSFIRPNLAFPSIAYLGLRVSQPHSRKLDFKMLFAFLEELRSRVPSLHVVQLLSERNVRFLLQAHTEFAICALQPFMENPPFRIEDGEGVLLTGQRPC